MNEVHIKDGFRRNGRIYEINRADTRRRNPYDI